MTDFHFNLKEPLAPCVPPFWASTGNLQTILGHLLPSPLLNENGERAEITLNGGDIAVAQVFPGYTKRVVYIFHGLGGSTDAAYMHRTALLARANGDNVIMFNHRGCGEGTGLAKEPYHSGRAEDLSSAIRFGRAMFPMHQHLAIGFSLSANALLLLVAGQRREFGADTMPDAAIAVNAPIDLGRAAVLLTKGLNRLAYDIRFMNEMRVAVKTRIHHDPTLAELSIPALTNLRDFDAIYTAPHGGFKSREHYYETCSAKQYLDRIEVPTQILTAADDPFVDAKDYREAKLSPMARLHIEACGGHMGYLSAKPTPLQTKRWLDYALATYMKSLPLP